MPQACPYILTQPHFSPKLRKNYHISKCSELFYVKHLLIIYYLNLTYHFTYHLSLERVLTK